MNERQSADGAFSSAPQWTPYDPATRAPKQAKQRQQPQSQKGRGGRRVGLRVTAWSGILGFLLFFCGMFFGLSWLLSPDPDVTADEPLAVTSVDGRDVVIVAYSRDGSRGMFQLIFQPMFQTRLAAMDAVTGATLWDVRLDEELANDKRVLAAENGLVYVAGDDGLFIRSLADGSEVAKPDAIPGIGAGYVAELGSYDVDPSRRIVVAIDRAGDIWQIPFGSKDAVPADADVDAAWRPVLAESTRFALSFPSTGSTARVDDGTTITGEPVKAGARTELLTLTRAEGSQPLGDAQFVNPQLVLDATPTGPVASSESFGREPDAAGRRSGYVLVVAGVEATGNAHRLSSVDLKTGAVIDAVEDELGSTVGGGCTREGVTALVAERADGSFSTDLLVVADRTGQLTTFRIGGTNFFGWPA